MVEGAMTVRDAILLAVPVFAAHARRGPDAIRDGLERAVVPTALAAEIVEFLPIAFARAMLSGMGIRFADHFVRQTAQGRVIGQKLLTDEPVYREGLAMANEISTIGENAFVTVASCSREYQKISEMLGSGSQAQQLVCSPPIMLANNEDLRDFDDTSGGVQPRPKTWWQFWK
jgi:hypothetical protein